MIVVLAWELIVWNFVDYALIQYYVTKFSIVLFYRRLVIFFTIVRNRATGGHNFKLFLPVSRVDFKKNIYLRSALSGFGTRCPTMLFQPAHWRCLGGGAVGYYSSIQHKDE